MNVFSRALLRTGGVLALVCVLGLSLTNGSAFAQKKVDERYSIVVINGKEVIRDSVDKVYISSPVLADGTQLTLQNYKNILEESDFIQEKVEREKANAPISRQDESPTQDYSPSAIYQYYSYDEDLGWQATGSKVQVSAWVDCPSGTTACTIQSTNQKTISHSFSTNVESGWKETIRVGATYQFQYQLATSTSYTLPIEPGKTGYMSFRPWINYTRGYVTTSTYRDGWFVSESKSGMVFANGPDKLSSGEANGIYAIEYPYN
ncbi:hypothetical protein PC41400_16700 [Paenibacillus chitinolyticus]|uniref:Uncharacterized protein n=1 Tax=Paenibacillus chitinolyticus TaxID=79263 RepID=A0A410WYE5_9BACL|nr:hypothetical protein [Paenibacillus chitinolyticus]MCY9589855.1 hypothetical protein [Paenibacillus chitinolyticus]MCY9598144.1 hypothetical protein [Paenibacillus chitinolyticus]QAV19231.1 hypothetical protein PC41400_16700 [Paenibacillus chitinolyticus]